MQLRLLCCHFKVISQDDFFATFSYGLVAQFCSFLLSCQALLTWSGWACLVISSELTGPVEKQRVETHARAVLGFQRCHLSRVLRFSY